MLRAWLILLRLHALFFYLVCACPYSFGSDLTDLPTATPESQGVDSRLLEECLSYIRSEHLRIHSLLMVRHGKVVLDAYFYPFQKFQLHDIASVTKSITSAVVGKAIDDGKIKGARQSALDLLPAKVGSAFDSRKKLITVEDLLTMRSGFDCGFRHGEMELAQMRKSPDWADFILNLPMRSAPGKQFSYCSCNPFLLSAILSAQTGTSELEFARQQLFSPLGITSIIWPSDPKGRTYGWGDLHLFPKDMAKIGVLFLNDGKWNGRTLISSSWVEKSLTSQVQAKPKMGYGYAWWINQNLHPPGFEAAGRGGQQIAILPAYDAVIVFTGGGFHAGKISSFLLRSMTTLDALPENSRFLNKVREQLRFISQEPDGSPSQLTPMPGIAPYVSDRKYVFPTNSVQLRSIHMRFASPLQAHAKIDLAGQVFDINIGLNNRADISQGQYGLPIAAKGRWLTAKTFLLDLDTIANINHFMFKLTFAGNRLLVRLDEVTGEVQNFQISGKRA